MAKTPNSKTGRRVATAAANLASPAGNAPPPRLGMVMRFQPGAAVSGVRGLETSGFRVASSGDFRSAASVPNDFGGADVQFFERFGIAIVRSEGERLQPLMQRGLADRSLSAVRAERVYRALGQRSLASDEALDVLDRAPEPDAGAWSRDYLRGWRDSTNRLIDGLLAADVAQAHAAEALPGMSASFDESAATWGLQATRSVLSRFSGAGIKLAVLDTGFDHTHPDFLGRSVVKKLFASASVEGDVVGHGTHCIGTACGSSRPVQGPRYGVAHEAMIHAGKVLGDDGFGTDRSIIAGLDWALDQGCQVISMSLGAAVQVGAQPSDDYEQIGQVCLDSGSLVVAAAGNESKRPSHIAPVGSPANASTIMAVGSVDRNMRVARFSCGGINPGQAVDIAAPGVDIYSCLPGGGYARWNGTSMATPHVAGIAALIAESDAKYRGWALWARLLQLAQRLNLPVRDAGRGLTQAPVSGG